MKHQCVNNNMDLCATVVIQKSVQGCKTSNMEYRLFLHKISAYTYPATVTQTLPEIDSTLFNSNKLVNSLL